MQAVRFTMLEARNHKHWVCCALAICVMHTGLAKALSLVAFCASCIASGWPRWEPQAICMYV